MPRKHGQINLCHSDIRHIRAVIDGWRSVCDLLRRHLQHRPQRSPSLALANNIDSVCLFSVNIAWRLSGLITHKDEGNVSSVAVRPLIGEVIDKGRASF